MAWKSIKEHYGISSDVVCQDGNYIIFGTSMRDSELIILPGGSDVVAGTKLSDSLFGDASSRYKTIYQQMKSDRGKLASLALQKDFFQTSVSIWMWEGARLVEHFAESAVPLSVTHDGKVLWAGLYSTDKEEIFQHAVHVTKTALHRLIKNAESVKSVDLGMVDSLYAYARNFRELLVQNQGYMSEMDYTLHDRALSLAEENFVKIYSR